jgi:hypothetical protein
MAFGIPDLLSREIRHVLEGLHDGIGRLNLREQINSNPRLAVGGALSSALLLVVVLIWGLWPESQRSFQQGKLAWFYDTNTGKLFVAGSGQAGPIEAPSGPTPAGEPAGFRSHVYSYVLAPQESELFAGFLERPDPDAEKDESGADMADFDRWARGRLIKRTDDKEWVRATSPEGQVILDGLTRPNKQGQTPIYQLPGPERVGK